MVIILNISEGELMKQLLALLLSISLCFTLIPQVAFAIEPNEKEFEKFLKEINWKKEDYIHYLTSKGWTLDDFYYIDELGTPLTEESIQVVLTDFDLTRDELNELLIENGDIEKDQDVLDGEYLIFSEELYDFVDFYLNEMVGTPINDENLKELLIKYNFSSVEELEAYLNKYDDSLEYYDYVEDLDFTLDLYVNGMISDEEMYDLFSEIGLTEKEIDNLFTHLEQLNWEDSTILDRLVALSDRMIAFEDFESAEELTAEQIAEILSIFTEMLDILQLDIHYYLVKDGQKEAITISKLLSLDSVNGADLLLEIYNKENKFLADILFTADMFGSEVIKETGKDIKQAEVILEKVKETKSAIKGTKAKQTVKGAKLPNTAGNYLQNTLIGLFILLGGFVLLQRNRKKEF